MNKRFQTLIQRLDKLSNEAEALQNDMTNQLETENKELARLQNAKRFDPEQTALQGQLTQALEQTTKRMEQALELIFECQDDFDEIVDDLR